MATLPVETVTLPAVLRGQTNGRLPSSILDTTPGLAGGPIVTLVEPAARAWRAMTAAARTAGHTLKATSATDSYRPYEVQRRIFLERYTRDPNGTTPRLWDSNGDGVAEKWYHQSGAAAAVPSTSNHGYGLAVDIGEESDGDSGVESIDDATVAWLTANAWRYGFSAELQSERWHWRYYRGDDTPAAVLAYEEGLEMLDGPDLQLIHNMPLGRSGVTLAQALQNANSRTAQLVAAAAADETRDAAVLAAVQALANAGGVDAAPIVAAVREEAETTRHMVTELQAHIAELDAELASYRAAQVAAAKAAADKLAGQ